MTESLSQVEQQRSLDRSALKGVAWTSAAKWSTQFFSWAGTILVARILVPSDIGLLTTAGVFMGVVMVLSEFGIGTAVITLRELPDTQMGQLNSFSVLLGLAGSVLTLLMSVPLGGFFNAPELPPVLSVVGLTFAISAWQVVPGAILRRDMEFKTIAGIDLARGLITPAVTLVGAMLGMRYWALALGNVVSSITTTGLTLYFCRVPLAWPNVRALAPALSFSRDVLVGRLAWIVYQNGDFAVAARRMDMSAVGLYGMAWTLATSPIEKITMILQDVTPSLFSSAQHDQAELRRYFLNISELIGLVTIPAGVGLALVSRDLVAVALGPKWQAAATPLALLALYAGARSVTTVFGHLFAAARETRFAMWTSVALSVLLVAGFIVGSEWGPSGIAATWLVVHPGFSVFSFTRVKRVLDLNGLAYLRVMRLGLDGSAVMAGTLLAFNTYVAQEWSPLMRLPVSIILGGAVFVTATLLLHRGRIRQILAWFKRVRGRQAS